MSGDLRFRRVRPPSKGELEEVFHRTVGRIHRDLERQGCVIPRRGSETRAEEYDPAALGPTVFDVVQAASIREWIGLSDDPRKVPSLGKSEDATGWVSPQEKRFCAAGKDRVFRGGRSRVQHSIDRSSQAYTASMLTLVHNAPSGDGLPYSQARPQIRPLHPHSLPRSAHTSPHVADGEVVPLG